jgi:threonine dehydratase
MSYGRASDDKRIVLVSVQEVTEAAERIKEVVVKTPFSYAPVLSRICDANIYLKKENLQLTGAFKLRGAFNRVASLSDAQKKGGVVAASAGNHAQGVAFSAKHFNIDATIVMPESTPLTKVNGVAEFGATVVLKGASYDDAYAHAKALEEKENRTFIHPFTDAEVIAGQGTVALEMLDEISDLDVVMVPVGGGGLIAGIARVIKELKPTIKVIGVVASGASGFHDSFHAKKNMGPKVVRTIADGIAVRDTADETLAYALTYVDDIVKVDEKEIAAAILFLLERQKLLVEGAGAVGVAALMHQKVKLECSDKVGVLLSGGNIDVTMLSVIIEKGLVKSSRKMKLLVTLVDKPGSLMHLTEVLSSSSANIVHIGYDRTSANLEYGDAHVRVEVETKGVKHQEEILKGLHQHGYKIEQVN